MKNIEKANKLIKLKSFLKENDLNITACGCCGGYHIDNVDGDELCCGEDFINEIDEDIKYYKENQNKIHVKYYEDNFTRIDLVKVDNKIVNLGGRSYPFWKYVTRVKTLKLI